MPTIRLTCVDTHTEEQLAAFLKGAHRLAMETLGAAEDAVIIHIETLPMHHYMRAGKTIAERRGAAIPKKA